MMTTSALADRPRTIALIGNPNTGKSTLFNSLSGLRQHVGNYPGVTVEKRTGSFRVGGRDYTLIDLPGTYSLVPRSPDEVVTVDVLLGRRADMPAVDAVVCLVDASNLTRNLYLVTQILQLRVPTLIALNMVDVARDKGLEVDADKLSQSLGVPVVPINAQRQAGLDALRQRLEEATLSNLPEAQFLPAQVRAIYDASRQEIQTAGMNSFLVERLFLDDAPYLAASVEPFVTDGVRQLVSRLRQMSVESSTSLAEDEAQQRYRWIEAQLSGVITRVSASSPWTDRLDRFLLHPTIGLAFAALAMLGLFQAVYAAAEPASMLIDHIKEFGANLVRDGMPDGALRSLLIDGLLEGVGGVLVFVPQIMLLFFFIALLEDTGYLSRVACLMDRLMSRIGLSGKSFIPLLSSFACAIPGIMAARVIDNRRDRLITMLVAPLMSCSARIPVYVLMTSAFLSERRLFAETPGLQLLTKIPVLGRLFDVRGLATFAMYLLGIVVAVVVAWVLKKTILRGTTPPFVLELPSYKWPSASVVLRRVWQGGWSFIEGAGTIIVAVTILVWAAAYFPHRIDPVLSTERDRVVAELDSLLAKNDSSAAQAVNELPNATTSDALNPSSQATTARNDSARLVALQSNLEAIENRIDSKRIEASVLGMAGRWIAPVVKPLGWDWRIGCAVLASFPAREVVVATMGVIYGLGSDTDETSASLQETLRAATWENSERPVFTVPTALSVMVFFALCAQCTSTLAVMRRETNSWRWPVFTFVYMTTLAYIGAWLTYSVTQWFSW